MVVWFYTEPISDIPKKMTLSSKSDLKIIISLCWSKSVTHSVDRDFHLSRIFRSNLRMRSGQKKEMFYGPMILGQEHIPLYW